MSVTHTTRDDCVEPCVQLAIADTAARLVNTKFGLRIERVRPGVFHVEITPSASDIAVLENAHG